MLAFIIELFKVPAVILGLVAMIGLILQKKSFGDVFSGTVKTAIGMLIVSAGAGMIVNEIIPFSVVFTQVFNLQGFATGSEAVSGALQSAVPAISATSAAIMGLGFLVNIVLARFTPLKYIFLTGHMLWILSVVVASGLVFAGYSEIETIIWGSAIQGLVSIILPAIAQTSVEKVTKNSNFALGHLTNIGTVAAGYVGGLVGNKEKDAESLKLPAYLNFFKDTAISVSIVMGLFYLGLFLIAGPTKVAELTAGQNYIIFAILKALGFTAGILILLQGIRLFLGELVPSFKGISDKVVPGAIPALDVPVLFGFAPNSLMIGFLTGIIGMLIGMVVSSLVFGVVPLISIIGSFFTGGTAGIFGNSRGGVRGASVAGAVYGFILIFFSGMFTHFVNLSQYGIKGIGHDCTDAVAVSFLLQNPILGTGLLIVFYIVLCLFKKRKATA